MIINGLHTLYFLFGVACTLLVACVALWIATKVMERKIKKMEKELGGGADRGPIDDPAAD